MNVLIVVLVGLACCGVVVLLGVGMMLDARARRERMGERPDRRPDAPRDPS